MSIKDHKLKPCPFCGCGAIHRVNSLMFDGSHLTTTSCRACYARITNIDEKSAKRWNERDQDRESLVNKIKALIDSLKRFSKSDLINKHEIEPTEAFAITLENLINETED